MPHVGERRMLCTLLDYNCSSGNARAGPAPVLKKDVGAIGERRGRAVCPAGSTARETRCAGDETRRGRCGRAPERLQSERQDARATAQEQMPGCYR